MVDPAGKAERQHECNTRTRKRNQNNFSHIQRHAIVLAQTGIKGKYPPDRKNGSGLDKFQRRPAQSGKH